MRILLAVALLFLSSLASAQIGPGGGGGGCSANCTFTGTTELTGPASFDSTVTAHGDLTVNSPGAKVSAPTITSTVATGTAPLTVTSTTNVANLNASSLSGATMASPGAIGGTTAAAGTFTTVSANTAVSSGKMTSLGAISFQGQAASTDGATVTNNAWKFPVGSVNPVAVGIGSNQTGWYSPVLDTTVSLSIAGSQDFQFAATYFIPALSNTSLGLSGFPWNTVFAVGAASMGSFTANSNGIESAQTTWGAVTSGAIVSAGAPVTTGTITNIVNLSSLPAGVYDVTVFCDWNIFNSSATAGPTIQQCGVGNAATTFQTQAGSTAGNATILSDGYAKSLVPIANATTSDLQLIAGPVRVRCTAACTLYHTSALTFANGTAKAFGSIRAVRVQ